MVLLEVELSTRFENANDLPDVHLEREKYDLCFSDCVSSLFSFSSFRSPTCLIGSLLKTNVSHGSVASSDA